MKMANTVKVDGDALGNVAIRTAQIENAIQESYAAANYVRNGLNWEVRNKACVDADLRSLCTRLQRQKNKLESMSSVAAAAAEEAGIQSESIAKQVSEIVLAIGAVTTTTAATNGSLDKWLRSIAPNIKKSIDWIITKSIKTTGDTISAQERERACKANLELSNLGMSQEAIIALYQQGGVEALEKRLTDIKEKSEWDAKVNAKEQVNMKSSYWNDYSGQCVGYVNRRIADKVGSKGGFISLGSGGAAKDFVKKAQSMIDAKSGKYTFKGSDGKTYQMTTSTDGVFRENSIVSFGSTKGNKYGHVIVVEAVKYDASGTAYVYFTEGNNKSLKDGTLQCMTASELLQRGGGYIGSVTYTEV